MAVEKGYRKQTEEYRILEVSPSGNWVKLQNINGTKFWKPVTECSLVEELIEIKPEKPPEPSCKEVAADIRDMGRRLFTGTDMAEEIGLEEMMAFSKNSDQPTHNHD